MYVCMYSCVSLLPTYTMYATITITTVCSIFFHPTFRYSAHNGDLQTTTVLTTHKAISHKADWILTTCRLLFLAVSLSNTNSLTNVFEVEGTWSRFLDNIVVCASVCLSVPFSLMLVVVVGLLGTSSIYLLV